MRFDKLNWKQNSLITFNFFNQHEIYDKIDDYCSRFQKIYENVKKNISFYVVREKFVNNFKIVKTNICFQSFI